MKNNNNNNDFKLHPNFVTGLTDAEGCFSILKKKDSRAKYGINIGLRFQIKMLDNETELLKMVKSFFDAGVLYYGKDGTVDFSIQDIASIKNKVIPHFLKYPLRGTKYLDFLSFKEAFHVIESKEHLTEKGLDKLYNLSKGMNTGREFPIDVSYSPNHTKESNIDYITMDGHYVNGFIAGDGCLSINLKGKRFGYMYLSIGQHKNNKCLLESIGKYFNCLNKVYSNGINAMQINLTGVKLWKEVIFVHFSKYPFHGTKVIKLDKLIIISELKNKKYLMKSGKSNYVKQVKNI
jgi:hypothetical protein